MIEFKKGYFFKLISLVLVISFFFQTSLYSQSALRVPSGQYERIRQVIGGVEETKSGNSRVTREIFRDRIVNLVLSYLSGQYNMPVYAGLTPKQTEALFEKYKLSQSINDPALVIETIQLIMENNMRFNHMYNGHMLTTPLALPVFINQVIDFVNSNQADPKTEEMYQLIERQTIQWLARIMGYEEKQTSGVEISPDGIITNGGTVANMLALKLIRDTVINKALREAGRDEDVRSIGLQRALELLGNKEAVFFISQEAHYSWGKMGGYEGLGAVNVVGVEVDSYLRMNPEDLRKKVANAKKNGKIILGIMATVGTTETGNIDPVDEIYRIAKEGGDDIWLHVDGAYGGACILSNEKELRRKTSCMSLADSVTIDPHKFLYIPYNLGALIVKDSRVLDVLRPHSQEKGILAQSFISDRRFDALKLWVALQWVGTDELGRLIDHVNGKTKRLYDRLKEDGNFDMLSTPEMDLFTFRYIPPDVQKRLREAMFKNDKDAVLKINKNLNELTCAIQKEMEKDGRGWLSRGEMANSPYSPYINKVKNNGFTLDALRLVMMNPFVNDGSIESFYRIIKNISQKVALEHAQEWDLGAITVDSMPEGQEGISPSTFVEHSFQNFFLHPETLAKLSVLGRNVVDLTLDGSKGVSESDVDVFREGLSDFKVPKSKGDEANLLKKLRIIVDVARRQHDRGVIPETAMAGNLVYPALNPNQIAWEVSPASTYAEAKAIKWLAELLHYREYEVELGGVGATVTPGGIITNSTTMANITALLVARNVSMERLLHNYNEQQRDPAQKIDVTNEGFLKTLDIIRKHVTRNSKSRMLIITSTSSYDMMRELALFIGMGPQDVIAVGESETGTIDPRGLWDKIVKEKQKGNIVMMVVANLGKVSPGEAHFLKRVFRNCTAVDGRKIWVHTLLGGDECREYFNDKKKFMEAILRNANSMTINLQSLMDMPYGLGIALFQNEGLLKSYLKQSAPYVIRAKEAGEMLNLSGYSPEGSKGFQALGLFLTLLLYGNSITEAVSGDNMEILDAEIFKSLPREEAMRNMRQIISSAVSPACNL